MELGPDPGLLAVVAPVFAFDGPLLPFLPLESAGIDRERDVDLDSDMP